jgi:hypothetical protein
VVPHGPIVWRLFKGEYIGQDGAGDTKDFIKRWRTGTRQVAAHQHVSRVVAHSHAMGSGTQSCQGGVPGDRHGAPHS